jgi:hypothetical protein
MLLTGCRQDMHDQPKYKPFKSSRFFSDGRASRPLIAGTVARGFLREDEHLYRGQVNGKDAETFPIPVTAELMVRGQERFNIYCTPCHDHTGNGLGMVVRRGLRRPPSFHQDRLRNAPVGHFYDVITNGFGLMQDYSAQIAPRDRWAIIAYIRALQRSQYAPLDDVPADQRSQLDQGGRR